MIAPEPELGAKISKIQLTNSISFSNVLWARQDESNIYFTSQKWAGEIVVVPWASIVWMDYPQDASE